MNGVTIDGARFKSTFETIETDFTESKTIERFLALDVQSRFSFSDDKTNYFLADLPDTRHLTREAMGLTASTREEEYARFVSTNSDAATSTNGVFRLSVHQYWRTADIFDSGDIFHKLQRSEFSTDLLTFSAMWHEIADGAEVEVTAKKLHIDGVPVKALAENIETVTFSVSAYQLSVHELNDQGKWNLVAASFEEVRLTGTGLGWTVLEDVTVTAFTYQIPALERHGEHASVLKMINVIGYDSITVTFLSPRHSMTFFYRLSYKRQAIYPGLPIHRWSPKPIWTYEEDSELRRKPRHVCSVDLTLRSISSRESRPLKWIRLMRSLFSPFALLGMCHLGQWLRKSCSTPTSPGN